jgi:hypothetical protein
MDMITNCPQCRKTLRFSDTQKAKILAALEKLAPGKQLTIKCPHCRASIKIDGLDHTAETGSDLQPPAPPDLDWLTTGRFAGEEKVEDVPMSLVLFADSPERKRVVEAMKSVGYQVVIAETAEEAMKRMQFVNFSCVTLHTELEGGLANSVFHDYMRKMSMERRRYIFYILIGPEQRTLYNLEALSTSANLVVSEKNLKYFDVILRKSIPEYEELFGPILEELAAYGKR